MMVTHTGKGTLSTTPAAFAGPLELSSPRGLSTSSVDVLDVVCLLLVGERLARRHGKLGRGTVTSSIPIRGPVERKDEAAAFSGISTQRSSNRTSRGLALRGIISASDCSVEECIEAVIEEPFVEELEVDEAGPEPEECELVFVIGLR